MKNERLSGRAARLLRPVLLGGAAAAVWLVLAAPTASAETGPGLDELAGSLDSTLSAAAPSAALPAPPPGSGGDSSGLLSPVLGSLPGSLDWVIAPATAGKDVPPGALHDPAVATVELVDGTAAEAVRAVIPIASGLLPASGNLVDPLAGVVADIAPLPSAPSLLPVAPAPAATPAADPGEATTALPSSLRADASRRVAPAGSGARPAASLQKALPRPSSPVASGEAQEPVDDLGTAGVPDAVPAVPGSGAGSAQSASGPGAGAAAETTVFVLRPPPGLCETSNPLQTAPEPVSFDPGSSPD